MTARDIAIVIIVALVVACALRCIKARGWLEDHADAFDIDLNAADWSHKETDQ